ncbi:MAG: thioredoxin domain-containing protein [Acetobacteraceae bacterium]
MTRDRNLLKDASSPYLLQHADNPVHWRQWGADALAEAKTGNKPILLSIGYAACHWCHVMAHESFEDAATAAEMNRLFVNIKVDREERPDIDQIYMSALQAMGEHGGWPLTMFLTPEGQPFWGGTYFPPEPRWGKPSFRQVLVAIAGAWQREPRKVTANAQELTAHLAALGRAEPGRLPGEDALGQVAASLMAAQDPVEGGFRGAPKFANPPLMRFLWQDSFRSGRTGQRDAVRLLLRRMSMGGIYDHLGGGFARYATDPRWLVPHFEKMLYDNAQILELLALAQAEVAEPLFAARAAETVGWLEREMRTGEGEGSAFASSRDADSEGVEGKFYVWDAAEIGRVLGSAAAGFSAAYDVAEEGNWEGRTILHRLVPMGAPAFEASLAEARERLFAVRERRVPPARDDKVLADWNGLAVAALARAAAVFDAPRWLALAGEVFDFVLRTMGQADGRVAHAWRRGRVSAAGLLEDQAAMARAAVALYEATGDRQRLEAGLRIIAAAESHFAGPEGAYYGSAEDALDLPAGGAARTLLADDHAVPSGNGMLAEVFARLFHLTGEDGWRVKAERLIGAFMGRAGAMVQSPGLLGAADLLIGGASVVVAGNHPELAAVARKAPDPAVVVLEVGESAEVPTSHPAAGRLSGAIVCRGGVCSLPVTEPGALSRLLHRT